MIIKIVFLKLKTKGNIAFLLVFSILQLLFIIFSYTKGISNNDLQIIFNLNCKFFYISTLVVFSTEKTSGFLAKQLSNGLSRKDVFLNNQFHILILAAIYFLFSSISLYCISLYVLEDVSVFNRFSVTLLSFIVLAQLAYLFVLFFKKTIYAVLVPYFIFLGFDINIFEFLLRYDHNNFIYLFPHGLSLSLPQFYNEDYFNTVILTLMFLIIAIPFLSYYKLIKTSFDD
ncbi:hypothetical protein QYS48_31645 [Marivirga arenosa]|uniref:Uncharacterized protein n=1 Tax=Marivirga arenosa TaxID=3059076 RepID=A0AA51N4L1_9BACT|nr:hypothetical protein [Marivirga sp. ABR2-2]WMN06114.1 hypothetical protein QYS48_31645 [Marivirga sp. ABR2-2]